MRAKKTIIIVLSAIIPIVVALLLSLDKILPMETVEGLRSFDGSFLPPMYAVINGLTAIILIGALIAVRKQNFILHQRLIKCAMVLSVLFLIGYVSYHLTTSETLYGDLDHDGIRSEDEAKLISGSFGAYFFILMSHIVLSMGIIPLVLFSYLYGSTKQIQKHKRLVKFAFPMWLYVAITGVIIYLMISPYYA